jgi:hypothetical protein
MLFTDHESCNISRLAVDGLNLYQPMLELPSDHQTSKVLMFAKIGHKLEGM